MPGLFLWNS